MNHSLFDFPERLSVAHQAGIPHAYFVFDPLRTWLCGVQAYADPTHVPNVVDYDGAALDKYQWRVRRPGSGVVRTWTARQIGFSTEILFTVIGEMGDFSTLGRLTNFYVVKDEVADWEDFVAAFQRAGLT